MALSDNTIIGLVVGMPVVAIVLLLGLAFGIAKLWSYLEPYMDQLKAMDRSQHKLFFWMGVTGVAMLLVLPGLLCAACYTVRPTEAFQDGSGSTDTNTAASAEEDPTLLADLAAAEDAVCKLITRVDGFIQNDQGPAGQSDSQLILAAQMKAREGVSMVDCSEAEAAQEDVSHRLTRLEATLKSFTGPELQRTYDTTMRCEGFADLVTPVVPTLRQRLTAVQATLQDQQSRLLAHVDQKTADLKRGIASDCDKKRAAAATQSLPGGGGGASP